MFCNLAHNLSAEKVNHELLCTAVMYAEGCERCASFFMWTGRPQFHPGAEVIGVDPSTLPLHRQSHGRNRTCHPQHCWSRGHAHGRRHPECFPLWQASLRRNLPDNDQGVQADRPEDVPVAQGVAALFMIMLFGGELWLVMSLKVHQTCRCWSFAAPPCFSPMVKIPCWVHSTTYSFIHHVDVLPRCSLNNIVRKILAFKQVVEMEISPTERLNLC